MALPTGTVTFLFTDIEGSAKLWEEQPEAMSVALARHDRLMYQAIARHEGIVFKTMGDAFCAAFGIASQALNAALDAQQSLQSETWPDPVTLRVRMAVHTGAAEMRDDDYFGPPLNRVARLLSAGSGGQALLSQSTYELVRDALPSQCDLHDLGSHALRDLARPEQVYQLVHPDLPSEFPTLKTLDNPEMPNNLPQQITSFIGREKELAQIKMLLGTTRLLTLTGSGGAGKTRLALQAAADVLDHYHEGVWLVELASVTDPALVPQTIATVLGIQDQPGQTIIQTLIDTIQSKFYLLILDNCEHLLNACAALVEALLRACPNLHILASSREGMNVVGEQTYRVPSLSLPDLKTIPTVDSLSQYEAVRLFLARVVLVKPDFIVTNQNAPAVASICHRVDGIPLALELAAARMRSLSVEEVNDRLDNRFRLLTGGSRTALPRQQTLRALIDWSYDLLNEQEKSMLCRLSVFGGGWTLAAAEAVCAGDDMEEWGVFDLLTSLADKSLASADEENGQTRYRLLETVRQYGRDKLAEIGEPVSVRDKHAAYFLTLAEEASAQFGSADQGQWLARLETEHDNLRAALAWFLEMPSDPGAISGLRLGDALFRFWFVRGYLSEGRRHLHEVLAASGAQGRTVERASVLIAAGTLAQAQGDNEPAILFYEEALAISRELGDKLRISDAVGHLGTIARNQGDHVRARALGEESLALARELGIKTQIASALGDLGMIAATQRDFALGRTLMEECLGIYREVTHQRAIAHFSNLLGSLISDLGDYAQGRALIEESLAVHRELGFRIGIASALGNLGYNALKQGDYAEARTFLEESLDINRELGDKSGIGDTLLSLGRLALVQDDYAQASLLYEASLTIQRELGHKMGICEALGHLGVIATRKGAYSEARTLIEESLGHYRDLANKSGIVESLLDLANIAMDEGNIVQSRSLLNQILESLDTSDEQKLIARIMEGAAGLCAAEGQAERAAQLFGAAEVIWESLAFARSPLDQPAYDRAIAQSREKLGDEPFESARAEGRALSWEQAFDEMVRFSGTDANGPAERREMLREGPISEA